jgi:type 1 glutamine amidotransferase
MRKLLILLLLAMGYVNCDAQQPAKRVLIFAKTAKYHHESIPDGIKAIQKLGAANNFSVDTTTNSALFTDDNLKRYAAVIFLSTSGNVLDTAQKISFVRYIEAGGGYMGIHGASTSDKDWAWYGNLVGAVFTDHPEPQDAVIVITDPKDPATKNLPPRWAHKDEWYNFRQLPQGVHVLFTVDESTYKGGKHGSYHPLAWYHPYDGGRAFYTAIGHFSDFYADPLFLNHLLAGINYAMGNHVVLNYSKVKTQPYQP